MDDRIEKIEKDDKYLDEILLKIGIWLNTPKVKIVNIPQMNAFRNAVDKLFSSIDGEWFESEAHVCECPLESGDITFGFDICNFIVRDTLAFSEAISQFSNLEIYPISNETMRFSAVFPKAFFVYSN